MKNSGVEWIGEIPDDWKTVKFKYLHSGTNVGESIDKDFCSEDKEGFVFYTAGLEPIYTNFTDFPIWKYTKKNDLLLARNGTPYVYFPSQNAVYSDHIIRVSIKNNYSKSFVKYAIEQSISTTVVDTVSIATWSASLWNAQNLPLPPKETQQKIASYLDSKCSKIEETIQNQQQVIEKLKAYKQSLITEAVTGKIKIQNGKTCGKYEEYKDSGVEWIGKIPSGWDVGKFRRFATVKSNLVDPNLYLDYPQIAPDNIEKSSGRLINYQSVRDSGVISWNHLFFKGQIVYSKIRPTLNKLIIAPFDGLCSADMYPIETELDKHFFVYMMLSLYFVEQVGLITRDRVKMPKINQNELSGILITVPSNEEQKNIAEYLDKKCLAIDNAIEQKQKIIEKLTEYTKSLIYECVTGKKDV